MTWKQQNNQLQKQHFTIHIIQMKGEAESILMEFFWEAMKGADTNPCMHLRGCEASLRLLNTPRRLVRAHYNVMPLQSLVAC